MPKTAAPPQCHTASPPWSGLAPGRKKTAEPRWLRMSLEKKREPASQVQNFLSVIQALIERLPLALCLVVCFPWLVLVRFSALGNVQIARKLPCRRLPVRIPKRFFAIRENARAQQNRFE